MSESRPFYFRCASGGQSFTDCAVARHGNLIRVQGRAQMDFISEDAKKFADAILDLLDNPDQEIRPVATPPDARGGSGDAIVDETISLLLVRAKLGQAKYGTTLMRNDLTLLDWMRHAVEESLDRTLYMLRAIKDLEKLYDDGR